MKNKQIHHNDQQANVVKSKATRVFARLISRELTPTELKQIAGGWHCYKTDKNGFYATDCRQ